MFKQSQGLGDLCYLVLTPAAALRLGCELGFDSLRIKAELNKAETSRCPPQAVQQTVQVLPPGFITERFPASLQCVVYGLQAQRQLRRKILFELIESVEKQLIGVHGDSSKPGIMFCSQSWRTCAASDIESNGLAITPSAPSDL